MLRHIAKRQAKRLSINASGLVGSSVSGDTCVDRLVGQTLAAVECELILRTLRHYKGNRTHAAKVLGISVRSLRDRIRFYRDEGESVPEPEHQSACTPEMADRSTCSSSPTAHAAPR